MEKQIRTPTDIFVFLSEVRFNISIIRKYVFLLT